MIVFLSSFSQADTNLQKINKSYLGCSIHFDNTGDINRFELCSKSLNSDLHEEIKKNRELNNFSRKEKWNSINLSLNSYLALCEANARSTQKNSTIRRDLISCNFFYYRSLAYESNKLNRF